MKSFAPGWAMTALVALLLPGLVWLGFWQLDRAAEKREYQNRYLEQVGAPPRAPPASLEDAGFLRVRVDGEYLAGEHYLVDNRVRNGRPGYWVVTRFRAADGRVFLVNRGWVAAPPERDQLPAPASPQGRVGIVGVIWPNTGLPPLLAADPWPEQWPKRVQRLNVARMAAEGTARVVAAEVRLEPGQPGGLAPVPTEADFRPERHQGYAVQWFALAATLAVGYVVFGLKRT